MSEQAAPEGFLSGINIPKVLAGTLAAVSAAVVGSFLGVAGTLVGAAVASIVGSIGTEIYERSLKHGAKKLQTLAPTFITAPAAIGTPEVAAATEQDSPSHTVPEPARKVQIRWGRIAAAAAGVFVLSMGAITVYEWVSGEPIAAAVGASNAKGTTLGGGDSNDKPPAPSPSATPAEQAPQAGSSADPNKNATTTTPAADPATTAPTAAVTPTDAVQQTADPGAGTDAGAGGGSDSGGSGGSDLNNQPEGGAS